MHLWTEYEGNTVAGAYTLGKLQRSEGRNAFFLTENAGTAALLRLTEALNDEPQLMARWNAAAAVQQFNLISILACGRAELDAAPLAWALLESTDATLADILRERTLTPAETRDVAFSVGNALAAVHAAGLIHEHIDASNVFAVGEAIKLRSDCVRECIGEFENDTPEARAALRQADIRDFGLLLLRCLTTGQEPGGITHLPAPFDHVVALALQGSVPLGDVLGALNPASAATDPSRLRPSTDVARDVEYSLVHGIPPMFENLAPSPTISDLPPEARANSVEAVFARIKPQQSEIIPFATRRRIASAFTDPSNGPWWLGGAIAAALLGIVFWNTGISHSAKPGQAQPAVAQPAPLRADPGIPKPSAAAGFINSAVQPGSRATGKAEKENSRESENANREGAAVGLNPLKLRL